MSGVDIILAITLAIIIGRAIQKVIINKKKGGCSCGCGGGCSGNCAACGMTACNSRTTAQEQGDSSEQK